MKPFILIAAIALSACGSVKSYEPIVDNQSIANGSKYQQDVKECRTYAQQTKPEEGLWLNVLSGNVQGMKEKNKKFESTFNKCMSGRGYSVLS